MPLFLIYGTFMQDQPGASKLAAARFVEEVRTASCYRLWFVDGRWPALIPDEDGAEIAAELYEIDEGALAYLSEIEPPGWQRSPVELSDGRTAEAFLGDPALRDRGVDISESGGWAAFVASRADREATPEPGS